MELNIFLQFKSFFKSERLEILSAIFVFFKLNITWDRFLNKNEWKRDNKVDSCWISLSITGLLALSVRAFVRPSFLLSLTFYIRSVSASNPFLHSFSIVPPAPVARLAIWPYFWLTSTNPLSGWEAWEAVARGEAEEGPGNQQACRDDDEEGLPGR